ncbi:hypothetical protein HPB47_017512 [Ixodes persulcatus]|uniref:Uncharacterized protein n=1 Tax=Ixodes persulcatus TaxID=34615 RepID=A0AC60R318_IXOPE|nr:hypothetical protein HPB47_017512 [Ixodes persulcatus]
MATADNAAKRRRLGARVSAGQFALLLDYLLANPVLVRAATDSPLSKEERTALWDIIVQELNVEGPSVKSLAEWKAFWNARVCAARRRDLDLSGATQRTGGGVNPVPPLSAEEERILSLVGTDSSRGCGGRRVLLLLFTVLMAQEQQWPYCAKQGGSIKKGRRLRVTSENPRVMEIVERYPTFKCGTFLQQEFTATTGCAIDVKLVEGLSNSRLDILEAARKKRHLAAFYEDLDSRAAGEDAGPENGRA